MLLKLRQVAERLNCSLSNVYALTEKGELPVHRVGLRKGLRIAEEDLTAYLAKVRVGTTQSRIPPKPKLSLRHLDLD